jgi:hypothetical protein
MAASALRQMVRTSVLKTNAYWPFGNCSRSLYTAAIQVFVRTFRDRKEVLQIYLRNGMAGTEWIPALSDIDFTIIMRSGLSDEKEFDFLESFWRDYRSLRFFFPMLGEVEILDEIAVAPCLEHGSCSPQSRPWMLLHGDADDSFVSESSAGWQRRALNCAMWIYLDLYAPCLALPDSYINRQDLWRRARRILRFLQPILADEGHDGDAGEISKTLDLTGSLRGDSNGYSKEDLKTDLTATVLVALEKAVGCFPATNTDTKPWQSKGWPSTASFGESSRRELSAPLPASAGTNGDGIKSVINWKEEQAWIILRDGLTRNEMCRVIEEYEYRRPKSQATPIVMPARVFAHMIRDYYPFDYCHLRGQRTVVWGADLLAEIAPPDRAAFVNHTRDRIPNILRYARSEDLFPATKRLSLPLFEEEMNRALALQLLLRDDCVLPRWRDVAAQCRLAFPEYLGTLEEMKTEVGRGRHKLIRQSAFRMFRSIATRIQELLAAKTAESQAVGAATS